MRNWNRISCRASSASTTVFTVPMRNWNIYRCSMPCRVQYVFTVPMRNWNLFGGQYRRTPSNVFTVPMRNWNFGFDPLYPCRFIVFTVPMRNWNIQTIKAGFVPYASFYSTYEELKLSMLYCKASKMSGFLQYLWGIETPHRLPAEPTSRTRFYSTYEELKHSAANRKHSDWLWVFTVPMRNWNFNRASDCSRIIGCFYSTYEELKPRCQVERKQIDNMFLLLLSIIIGSFHS